MTEWVIKRKLKARRAGFVNMLGVRGAAVIFGFLWKMEHRLPLNAQGLEKARRLNDGLWDQHHELTKLYKEGQYRLDLPKYKRKIQYEQDHTKIGQKSFAVDAFIETMEEVLHFED